MNLHSRLLILAFACGFPIATLACSCGRRPPLEDVVSAFPHIFVAQVTSSTLSKDKQWIEGSFEVEETLKGDPRKVPNIKVKFVDRNHDLPSGVVTSCGEIRLSPGEHLIVFAEEDGSVVYGECTRTRVLTKRDGDGLLEHVRKAVSPR